MSFCFFLHLSKKNIRKKPCKKDCNKPKRAAGKTAENLEKICKKDFAKMSGIIILQGRPA